MKSFRDYQPEERRNYITLSTGEYYPDILQDACRLYSPVLETFSEILHRSESSTALFMNLSAVPNQWMRTQLCRVFRKYVSPETPVEMLKKNTKEKMIPARDETGVLDLTPHEAVKNIVNEEKKELVRQYYETDAGNNRPKETIKTRNNKE